MSIVFGAYNQSTVSGGNERRDAK